MLIIGALVQGLFRETMHYRHMWLLIGLGAVLDWVRDALLAGDRDRLVNTLTRAPHALRAHPTPDHFLPLLVAAGAAAHDAPVTVLPGAVRYGMLSMESYLFGAAAQ